MQRYAYAARVISKVRSLLRNDNRYVKIINNNPTVKLSPDLYLENLIWNYYDLQIIVTQTQIMYAERSQPQYVIVKYCGFDELLTL